MSSTQDKKARVSDPNATSRDPEEESDDVIIKQAKGSPTRPSRRGTSESSRSPAKKEPTSDDEEDGGSASK